MKTRFLLLSALCTLFSALCSLQPVSAHSLPERFYINQGWHFHLGNAADPQKDFGHATEYFTYLSKASSIHNAGPYALSFDDSDWLTVNIPHDWVTTLPYSPEASHSHGYHTIGWRYPDCSVGWYRYAFNLDSMPKGKNGHPLGISKAELAENMPNADEMLTAVDLCFDGVFRDARIWLNGFYLGRMENGYLGSKFDVTDYLREGQNVICVRVDATTETGWFYEGAGIYRNVYFESYADEEKYENSRANWSPENLHYAWSADNGFMDNGQRVELRGVNLHQDHGGVGIAVPRGLMEYRLRQLMKYGVNAIRMSHNPAAPELLDLCDSLGLYVIAETRLMGSSDDQLTELRKMINRDLAHPSIILWSIGNEEWALEWKNQGERIARTMTREAHLADDSRLTTVATSSGPNIVRGADVAGYNYLMQNDIDGERQRYPERIALGTEETTGCGTRGIYYTDADKGHMAAINRTDTVYPNLIERGWKFYAEHPWLAGLFYWTGFDYMGEPNPMQWPAVGSQFGLLDQCGFPKDEAYYLQSWWTDTPTLHILPHWNLPGHEGESVDVWVYSNMDEVELRVNGKSLGRKPMPLNGHLSWTAVYQPGKVEAIGYKKGKKRMTETVFTAGPATQVVYTVSSYDDIHVIDITLLDKKKHFCPTACNDLTFRMQPIEPSVGRLNSPQGIEPNSSPSRGGRVGSSFVLGWHNGDPALHHRAPAEGYGTIVPFKAFNGHAQIILQGELPTFEISLE